jgi:hypothetical protein
MITGGIVGAMRRWSLDKIISQSQLNNLFDVFKEFTLIYTYQFAINQIAWGITNTLSGILGNFGAYLSEIISDIAFGIMASLATATTSFIPSYLDLSLGPVNLKPGIILATFFNTLIPLVQMELDEKHGR